MQCVKLSLQVGTWCQNFELAKKRIRGLTGGANIQGVRVERVRHHVLNR